MMLTQRYTLTAEYARSIHFDIRKKQVILSSPGRFSEYDCTEGKHTWSIEHMGLRQSVVTSCSNIILLTSSSITVLDSKMERTIAPVPVRESHHGSAMCIDDSDNVYIVQSQTGIIDIYNRHITLMKSVVEGSRDIIIKVQDIAVFNNKIYVLDWHTVRVYSVTSGEYLFQFNVTSPINEIESDPTSTSGCNRPAGGMTINHRGELFVSDNHRFIQVFDAYTGSCIATFQMEGSFSCPSTLSVVHDWGNYYYLCASAQGRIQSVCLVYSYWGKGNIAWSSSPLHSKAFCDIQILTRCIHNLNMQRLLYTTIQNS
jgi:hypothetical protein